MRFVVVGALCAVCWVAPASGVWAQTRGGYVPRAALGRTNVPSRTPLRWRAPRGLGDGRPMPSGTPLWTTFLGTVSPEREAAQRQAPHASIVPRPGLRLFGYARTPSTMQQIVRQLVRRGIAPAIATRAAPQLALGMPSDADRRSADDYLIVRNDVVISYNATRRGPNWVSWRTNASNMGAPRRSDAEWRADPTLPDDFTPATFADYEHSGFDAGHMVRSGERDVTARTNARTYVMSQTLPQAIHNNRGPWLHFENYYRDIVRSDPDAEVHVIAGGAWGRQPITIGAGIQVPAATWKVVVVTRRGQTLDQIDAATRVMAVMIPNSDAEVARTDSFSRYATTPAAIERATGLRFFTTLPANVATALRTRLDPASRDVVAPPPRTD